MGCLEKVAATTNSAAAATPFQPTAPSFEEEEEEDDDDDEKEEPSRFEAIESFSGQRHQRTWWFGLEHTREQKPVVVVVKPSSTIRYANLLQATPHQPTQLHCLIRPCK